MNQILNDFKSSDWWFTTIIAGLIIAVIGHFLFKYIDSLYRKYTIKGKEKTAKEELLVNSKAKEISSNSNDMILYAMEYNESSRSLDFKLLVALMAFTASLIASNNFKDLATQILTVGLQIATIIIGILYLYFAWNHMKEYKIYLAAKNYYNLKSDLTRIFTGKWQLNYSNQNSTIRDNEIVVIKSGNKYFRNNILGFNLRNVNIDIDNKRISFDKERLTGEIHSKEKLQIVNDTQIEGTDTLGFKLIYNKI